jgi:ribose/xylose/arabinose/galactoside ABC-type transport system permease subunit
MSLRALVTRPSSGVVLLLLVISAVMALASPSFLTVTNITNIANQMVYVFLLATGMTVVLIAGGIDLSVGSVLGLSAGVMAYLLNQGMVFPAAFALALGTGAVMGLLNGLAITRLGLPDFVATLAMLGIGSGLLFLWTNGVPFIGYMDETYYVVGGLRQPLGYLTVPILLAVVVSLAVAAVLRWTRFGRHLYGLGSNPDAARRSGVSVERVRVLSYVVSGTLAALAGILLAGRTTTVAPTMGIGYELQAIAAAVIGGAALSGGRGRVAGAFLGALTLTVAYNVINLASVGAVWQPVVIGVILLLAVVLDRLGALVAARPPKPLVPVGAPR